MALAIASALPAVVLRHQSSWLRTPDGLRRRHVFVAPEGQQQVLATRNVMVLHTDFLERLLRIALASHIAAVKRWTAYYLDQPTADAVVQEADRIADVLDEPPSLADIRQPSGTTPSPDDTT